MDLRAPFIPFLHVCGIPFDLTKEIKKNSSQKNLKNFRGNPYPLATKMSTTKNSKPHAIKAGKKAITLDINILEIVQGYKMNF